MYVMCHSTRLRRKKKAGPGERDPVIYVEGGREAWREGWRQASRRHSQVRYLSDGEKCMICCENFYRRYTRVEFFFFFFSCSGWAGSAGSVAGSAGSVICTWHLRPPVKRCLYRWLNEGEGEGVCGAWVSNIIAYCILHYIHICFILGRRQILAHVGLPGARTVAGLEDVVVSSGQYPAGKRPPGPPRAPLFAISRWSLGGHLTAAISLSPCLPVSLFPCFPLSWLGSGLDLTCLWSGPKNGWGKCQGKWQEEESDAG